MPSSTDYKTGYDKRNKKVLSWRRKAARDWEAVTSPGSSFQSLAAATGNAWSPTVTSRVGRTSKASVADERRRWRSSLGREFESTGAWWVKDLLVTLGREQTEGHHYTMRILSTVWYLWTVQVFNMFICCPFVTRGLQAGDGLRYNLAVVDGVYAYSEPFKVDNKCHLNINIK